MSDADEFRVDVAVVGAGPAGAQAAQVAAEAGCDVLLLDRRAEPGRPVQCGEWIPLALARRETLPEGTVRHRLAGMRTVLWTRDADGPPREAHTAFLRAPGLMIDRSILDAGLVRRALAAGAAFWSGATALAPVPGGILVRRRGRTVRVRAKVIVGADGPLSTVARWIGSRNRHLVVAQQQVLPLAEPAGEAAEVYFHPDLPGGYGWLFPEGTVANVGVGVNPALADPRTLARRLAWFVRRLAQAGRVVERPLETSGGWIPVGGMHRVVSRGPFLLAGDAAGLAHPLTGTGIAAALESGRWAGEFAARAVRTGRCAGPDYARRLRSALGPPLAAAAAARAWRDACWPADGEGLAPVIRRAWPGFDGYRAWAGQDGEGGDADGRVRAG